MKKFIARFLFIWAVALLLLFVFVITHTVAERALAYMTAGLFLSWVLLGGGLMVLFKDRIRDFVHSFSWSRRKKFFLFAILLALIEEAITTSLTNMAPLFGARIGEVYITASTNYLDVVFFHSVIVFVPMFFAWSILLSRYDFTPFSVFLLFGIDGVISEFFIAGPIVLIAAGFWIYVYGLMVYLPAYAVSPHPEAMKPKIRHYLLAICLPILFAIPVAIFVNIVHPYQPTHFIHEVKPS